MRSAYDMRHSVFLLLLIVFLGTSCRQPRQLVYKNVQNFKLKQDGLQSQVCLDVRMFNPNKYCMKLKDANVDVFINGRSLGKMHVANGCPVPRLDTFAMPVTLNVDLKNVLPNAFQLLMNGEVDIKLTGSVKAGKHGVYIKVPVSYEGKQDIRASMKW